MGFPPPAAATAMPADCEAVDDDAALQLLYYTLTTACGANCTMPAAGKVTAAPQHKLLLLLTS
jgi:hypothetical protein